MFRKKNNVPNVEVPRSLEVLDQEYKQFCADLGQLDYQVSILTQRIEEKRKAIQKINAEGSVRKKLDAETASKLASEKSDAKV